MRHRLMQLEPAIAHELARLLLSGQRAVSKPFFLHICLKHIPHIERNGRLEPEIDPVSFYELFRYHDLICEQEPLESDRRPGINSKMRPTVCLQSKLLGFLEVRESDSSQSLNGFEPAGAQESGSIKGEPLGKSCDTGNANSKLPELLVTYEDISSLTGGTVAVKTIQNRKLKLSNPDGKKGRKSAWRYSVVLDWWLNSNFEVDIPLTEHEARNALAKR